MILSNNTIWHLTHSSNAIKLANKLIIFDYPLAEKEVTDTDGIENGFIIPDQINKEDVYVFVSHGHQDHFSPGIFGWKDKIKRIKFIVSSDICDYPNDALLVAPNEIHKIDDIRFKTYSSTDCGVAFSLFIGDKHLYYSGDNAFWNWAGSIDDDKYYEEALTQIDGSKPIDLAFQVCDPRLEKNGAGGIYVFAHHFAPEILVPLHLFGDYEFLKGVDAELRAQGFRKRFWCIEKRGARYSF
jgi:L-ascorbate metabolism protein UlaG (beta-lactamase superfamily)